MNLQVICKAAILAFAFALLVPCRDLFVLGLIQAERMFLNIDIISDRLLMQLSIVTLAILVMSLVMTGIILLVAILAWKWAEKRLPG